MTSTETIVIKTVVFVYQDNACLMQENKLLKTKFQDTNQHCTTSHNKYRDVYTYFVSPQGQLSTFPNSRGSCKYIYVLVTDV